MFNPPPEGPYYMEWYDVFIIPFFFMFIGLLMWVGGNITEQRLMKPMKGKWAGLGLIVLGAFFGLRYPIWLRNPVYYQVLETDFNKRILLHWLAFVVPLVALIGSLVWYMFERRKAMIR